MDHKLTAAKSHLPARGRAIDELALRDEDFCILCGDLADAEAAAERSQSSNSPKRDQLRSEYLELVSGLLEEIETALDAATVIPLSGRRPKAAK